MAGGRSPRQKSEELISFRDVSLGYGRTDVVSHVSFEIYDGDFLGIVGPNGSGKTTIVRAILGTLKPRDGHIHRFQKGGKEPRISYVPQRDTIDLIMPYTVEDIVMMGRYRTIGLMRRPQEQDRMIVRKSLEHVGAYEFRGSSLKDLSGGQKQRTLIARALTSEPDVLVLDEPTNGMDLSSRTAILELIKFLHRDDKLTVIMVSHLLSDVANYVKRIAMVEHHLFEIGDTETILTSKNLSRMYGIPVDVDVVHGQKVVSPRARNV